MGTKTSLVIAFAVIVSLAAAFPRDYTKIKKETCYEGFFCEITPGTYGVCINGNCVDDVPLYERRNLSFSITIKYPEDKLAERSLFIRGNGLGLNWQQGFQLNQLSQDTWKKTFTYKSGSNGFICESCTDESILSPYQNFEYRILIDDVVDMIGANLTVELPISKSALPQVPNFEEYPWFTETSGSLIDFSIDSTLLGAKRSIAVYLPPSFNENPYKKYGGLLMYDLNPLYAGVFKTAVFDKYMAQSGIMKETIVVGWGDWTTDADRTFYLTQVPGTSFVCRNGTFTDQCGGCFEEGIDASAWLEAMKDRCGYPITEGGGGDIGLDFFIQEALPKAAELAQGRLLSDRENLGINGYSLGGLMACHATWTRPDVFGYGACQSSSLYWPMNAEAEMGFHFHNVSLKDPELLKNRKPQKFYLDVGGLESGPPFFMDLGAIEAADVLSSTEFFNMNENVWFNYYPDHIHSNVNWMTRFWSPVSVLLAPKGTPTIISTLSKIKSLSAP